jgi:hypothetical protein
MIKVHFISVYDNNIIKPTKNYFKREEERGDKKE